VLNPAGSSDRVSLDPGSEELFRTLNLLPLTRPFSCARICIFVVVLMLSYDLGEHFRLNWQMLRNEETRYYCSHALRRQLTPSPHPT
jgi:hypothetical protein